MPPIRTLTRALRVPPPDPCDGSYFEFRRVSIVPAWLQAAAVAASFVATVLLTHAEYRRTGTVLGFPGPAFNVLVAPIYEELVFRGWILARLRRAGSAASAIAISSLLFGLLHLRNVYWLDAGDLARTMAYTGLALGPFLAYVTLRARTVWPAVVLHYLNNLGYYA